MKRKRGCAIAVFGLLGVLLFAVGGNLLLGVPLPTVSPPMGYYRYIYVPIPGGEAIEPMECAPVLWPGNRRRHPKDYVTRLEWEQARTFWLPE